MKKKSIILLTTLLLLGNSVSVFADTTSTKAGKCEFNGEKMESSFDSTSIAVAVSEMEPGDTVNFSVDIKNTSDISTSWYMSNEVLSSLEDAQKVAENGGYVYTLTYTDSDGQVKTLYDSDSVGGEKESVVGVGLNEATDSLDEFFHLVNLDKNDSGTVNLSVTLDGESQGNIYQDTLAKLKMNFAVEKEETPGKSSEPDTDKTHRVKTGDIWMSSSVIMLIIGIALVVAAFFFMRKEGRVNEKNK